MFFLKDFKGLYGLNLNKSEVFKIFAKNFLPLFLEKNMVKSFFRYDTGSKEFKEIVANRDFTLAIDAISLNDNLFKNFAGKN